MASRIAGIFGRLRRPRKNSGKRDTEGTLYSLWLLGVSLLLGFVVGGLASSAIGWGLDFLAGSSGVQDVAVTGRQVSSESGGAKRGLDSFLAANPFRISPRKKEEEVVPPPPPPPVQEEETPQEPEATLDDVVLRGTFPGIAANFDVRNVPHGLVRIGQTIEQHELKVVTQYEAELVAPNGSKVIKHIVYGPAPVANRPEAPKPPAPAPAPAQREPEPQPQQQGEIVAAVPGGQEGQLPSKLVNDLVNNPMTEMQRVRIAPNTKLGGLQIQWIQNDSILKRLGVEHGDVIKSINGIPLTNMVDIANSIGSLMNSERFDVEVNRGGKNTALRYVVK